MACAPGLRPALPSRGTHVAPSWNCFGYQGCNESTTGMGPAHQDLKPSRERDTAPDRAGPKLLSDAGSERFKD